MSHDVDEIASMSYGWIFALTLAVFSVFSVSGSLQAREIFQVDPIVAKNMRTVDVRLSRSGGSIELPASDGVSARLDYPSNNACLGAAVHIAALGPAGVKRYDLDTVFVRAWKPFYLLTVRINQGRCQENRITFNGFPQLNVRDPKAAKSTIYYMDLAIETGNDTHIPVGPPDERDARSVVFSFLTLPRWARAGSTSLSVPTLPTYRIIIGRQ